jgi:hypothetical protein
MSIKNYLQQKYWLQNIIYRLNLHIVEKYKLPRKSKGMKKKHIQGCYLPSAAYIYTHWQVFFFPNSIRHIHYSILWKFMLINCYIIFSVYNLSSKFISKPSNKTKYTYHMHQVKILGNSFFQPHPVQFMRFNHQLH